MRGSRKIKICCKGWVGWMIVCAVILLNLSGCSTASYYSQSVVGHSKLMLARQPIAKVIESAPPRLKEQLELSVELKKFAESELSLNNNNSYTHYVELDREFPVWNVVAAPEFSLQAKQWCYPVIGCASYRGYFNKNAAEKYALKMQNRGFETLVGGATAYSTLGWFSDPILPSMLRYGDTEFAETLFHELAHQRLYINGDSNFNEAFATVVGEEGAKRWLEEFRPEELHAYQTRLDALRDFDNLLTALKGRLERIYASALDEQPMRIAKQREFAVFKDEYELLKARKWQGHGWFDRWLEIPLNNARLASFSTYYESVDTINSLLEQCEFDFDRFYRVLSGSEKVDGKVLVREDCTM